MISVDKASRGESYRFVLTPNCSISWRELLLFYCLTCIVALAVGLFFTLQGLWLVLPFSGLEMLALGIGLYITSRKVYRREVITLDPECTRIEKGVQRVDQVWEFKTPWVRVVDEYQGGCNERRKLAIGMSGESVEVGDFLANWEKDALAFQLKDCIIRD
ncbi:DUF2244 domain-containing protein [Gammaproteobacteria bacterium]|nr:DUF2244 domain-containing protein [Gammaproteobacteria bacterium]